MPELSRRTVLIAAILASDVVGALAAAAQIIDDHMRTAGGLTVYFGVMPAAIVKGHPTMPLFLQDIMYISPSTHFVRFAQSVLVQRG